MTELMFQDPAPAERSTTLKVNDRDLRAAIQLLETLVASHGTPAGDAMPSIAPSPGSQLDKAELAARARGIFGARRTRSKIFGKGMFGEPAWDMLLALYVADTFGPKMTIGRLSELAETPLTTAIRWLEYLEQQGLVQRQPHPTDRRAVFVEPSDKGRTAMEQFLSGTDL